MGNGDAAAYQLAHVSLLALGALEALANQLQRASFPACHGVGVPLHAQRGAAPKPVVALAVFSLLVQ